MKFLRYGPPGEERPGLLDGDGRIRNLSGLVPDLAGEVLGRLDGLAAQAGDLPVVQGALRLGPCVAGTGKYLCIGLNYSDHAAEAGMELPSEPILFMKATSAICGAGDPLRLPRGSETTDWEVELGVVIGRRAKYVSEAEALDHVAGYCVANDVSERDFQLRRAGQWTKGKSCDTFGPVGPWLVTPEEVPDPQDLTLSLEVNGERMQSGHTGRMVFGVARIVAYLSGFMTLEPGDIIATGTPPGVGMGMDPPRYLKPGDEVVATISGLGTQRRRVERD